MTDKRTPTEKSPFTDAEVAFIKKLDQRREIANNKFPLITSLFVTFGVICVFSGIEKMIDKFALFNNNPEILLVIGLIILASTGTIYKKLN